jgi:hypothetical protein
MPAPGRRSRPLAVALSVALSVSGLSATPSPAAATPAPVDPPAPAPAAAPKLSAEVVGYLPYWEMTAATFAEIDLTKLSSIILFSVGWDAAGHLRTDLPGYRAIIRADTRAFVDRAREAGIRIDVSFTSFG